MKITDDDKLSPNTVEIGMKVHKPSGYNFDGVIVGIFKMISGSIRVVVECTAPGAEGYCEIFKPSQLAPSDKDIASKF